MVINSALAAYYYLRVTVAIFMTDPAAGAVHAPKPRLARHGDRRDRGAGHGGAGAVAVAVAPGHHAGGQHAGAAVNSEGRIGYRGLLRQALLTEPDWLSGGDCEWLGTNAS